MGRHVTASNAQERQPLLLPTSCMLACMKVPTQTHPEMVLQSVVNGVYTNIPKKLSDSVPRMGDKQYSNPVGSLKPFCA